MTIRFSIKTLVKVMFKSTCSTFIFADEYLDILQTFENCSEEFMENLKKSNEISASSKFQTFGTDASRFLLKQREKLLRDSGKSSRL